jgi:hypothetical protein
MFFIPHLNKQSDKNFSHCGKIIKKYIQMTVDFELFKLYYDYYSIKTDIQMTKQNKLELKAQAKPYIKYAFNPWVRQYPKSAKKEHHQTTGTEFVIATGDDAKPVATFTSTYAVDKEQFCKLYLAGVLGLRKLNSSGMKVFQVLFNELRKNQGKDRIQMAYIMTNDVAIDISQPTYARGVRNLYENDFIAPVEGFASTWWVNPDFIFNGNRLNINNTYILNEAVDQDTGEITKEAHAKAA